MPERFLKEVLLTTCYALARGHMLPCACWLDFQPAGFETVVSHPALKSLAKPRDAMGVGSIQVAFYTAMEPYGSSAAPDSDSKKPSTSLQTDSPKQQKNHTV